MSDPGRKPATTAEDVLDVFESRDDRAEPLTAPELAEDLNCSRRTALNKLHDLEDAGDVSSKKVGGRSKVWWVPIHDTPADAVRRESGESTGDTPPTSSTGRDTAEDRDTDTDRLTAALDGLDTTDDRRAAVRACVEYLRSNGTGQKSDFVDAVYPDHNARFESAGGWWNTIGKEYLKALAAEYDPVEPPAKEGSHTWRYTE